MNEENYRAPDLAINLASLDLEANPVEREKALETAKEKMDQGILVLSPREAAAVQIEARENKRKLRSEKPSLKNRFSSQISKVLKGFF